MSARTIKIPAPEALDGDRVSVLNYRRRPATWEPGDVLGGPMYSIASKAWHYRVRLVRRSTLPGASRLRPIDVHVTDGQIKSLRRGGRNNGRS